jgi:hypothetical protein
MKLAICYSGRIGEALAVEVTRWLPQIVTGLDLFFAPRDIAKGEKWRPELERALERADASLLCLTSEGAARPWINWEASRSRKVYALLFGVEEKAREEFDGGPLGADQATLFEREDFGRLLRTMCSGRSELALNERRLTRSWPSLQRAVRRILKGRRPEFLDDLGGGWWEFVGSSTGATVVSFVQITVGPGAAGLHLLGKGYDEKGKVSATWESTTAVADPLSTRVVYAWTGQQAAERHNGVGEFCFFRKSDGRIGDGNGHFHDTNEVSYFGTKESQFVRASAPEVRTMLGSDGPAKARLVRKKLAGRA